MTLHTQIESAREALQCCVIALRQWQEATKYPHDGPAVIVAENVLASLPAQAMTEEEIKLLITRIWCEQTSDRGDWVVEVVRALKAANALYVKE